MSVGQVAFKKGFIGTLKPSTIRVSQPEILLRAKGSNEAAFGLCTKTRPLLTAIHPVMTLFRSMLGRSMAIHVLIGNYKTTNGSGAVGPPFCKHAGQASIKYPRSVNHHRQRIKVQRGWVCFWQLLPTRYRSTWRISNHGFVRPRVGLWAVFGTCGPCSQRRWSSRTP